MTTRSPLSDAEFTAAAERIREQASRILASKSATLARWEKYRAELEARENFVEWVHQARVRDTAYRRDLYVRNQTPKSKIKPSP